MFLSKLKMAQKVCFHSTLSLKVGSHVFKKRRETASLNKLDAGTKASLSTAERIIRIHHEAVHVHVV